MSGWAPPRLETGTRVRLERPLCRFFCWLTGQLLLPEADWTIVGSSLLSKTYHGTQSFLDEVIHPFNARMRTPLVPTVRGIYADGDAVITLFDAAATAADGVPYRNTYTWYFYMRDGKVTKAIAFFDTREFDEFWQRVKPQ